MRLFILLLLLTGCSSHQPLTQEEKEALYLDILENSKRLEEDCIKPTDKIDYWSDKPECIN